MEKNWKAIIEQQRKVVFSSGADWYREIFELHFNTLEEAQETVNALMSAWPHGWPDMKVKIEWCEMSPNTDTIPDTDFMEGGDS